MVKHAGLGGENTGWNTGAFQIQTSTDGAAWTTAATVTGSRASRTYHPVAARTARYVRLVDQRARQYRRRWERRGARL